MGSILSSSAFWFGAILLLIYQGAKFSELSTLVSTRTGRESRIPNLRASDFAGPASFFGTLFAYLVATFVIYLAACSIAPSIIVGWTVISGGPPIPAEAVEGGAFPLYISALYMGLTQPGIPVLSSVANLQRDIFHFWIGVPKRVISTSEYFLNQLLAEGEDDAALTGQIRRLTSTQWIARFDSYADAVFYRGQLERLKLSGADAMEDVAGRSVSERRDLLDNLVFAASIAAVRESGGRALNRLARDLGVGVPVEDDVMGLLRRILPGALLALVAVVVAMFALPMASSLAEAFDIGLSDFWPDTPVAASTYIAAQVVPLVLAAALILCRIPREASREDRGDGGEQNGGGILAVLNGHALLLLAVFTLVVVFDYAQMLSDYSNPAEGAKEGAHVGSGALAWLAKWAPYHMLHALIAVSMVLMLLMFVSRCRADESVRGVAYLARMCVAVGLAAAFYAIARLEFQYADKSSAGNGDYVVLIVLLNVAGAVLALTATDWTLQLTRAAERNSIQRASPVPERSGDLVSFPRAERGGM
jgi:hypothetical protein